MKKRYVVLVGILAVAAVAAGCGKKKEEDNAKQEPQVTVAPVENSDKEADNSALVNMQTSEDENIKNVMGDKTATASKVILINSTGAEVKRIYIRPNTDDDEEWGVDLIDGKFTLKNGDKALYYFDKTARDSNGNSVSSYDIRIVYTDEDRSECYFRKIPLQNISQITLRMDGTGEDSIPYATYMSGNSKRETSTLNDVKRRLGLTDSGDDEDDDKDSSDQNTATPTQQAVTPTPAAGTDPGDNDPTTTDPSDEGATAAESYIGQPLENLISAMGEPNGNDYENEPETGETGYHYYDSFTVSTTVDENGNEIVAGVW